MVVVVGVHRAVSCFRAETLANVFTLDFRSNVNEVIIVDCALKLYATRAGLFTCASAGLFLGPQKAILKGNLFFAPREQETGILWVEVAVRPKKVERQAGQVVLTQE